MMIWPFDVAPVKKSSYHELGECRIPAILIGDDARPIPVRAAAHWASYLGFSNVPHRLINQSRICMRYHITPIHCRPWQLNGLSLKLIESHYENNYGGALKRLNAITEQLDALDPLATPAYQWNALKREELVAMNSTLLHELYFASLAFGDGKPTSVMAEALSRDFGSVKRWRDEFVAMGYALAGGSGWALLSWLPRDGRLLNHVSMEHTQSIPGAVPILAMDMYEHAYHLDFGANAKGYVDTFMRNIDWKSVEDRYIDAKQVSPVRPLSQPEFGDLPGIEAEEVKAMFVQGKPVQFIDTRPRHYVSRTQDEVVGAKWRDPERIDEWIHELSKDVPVVTFCVYGFHVGCKTATALRDAGYEAKYMKGGHAAWKAIGGEVKISP
jgi:superoxide dismutase, Fe-Mn family